VSKYEIINSHST